MADKTIIPVIPSTRGDDLHHLEWVEKSQLNLFMAGNQFMVMDELVSSFMRQHPDIQRIYYQTLPPGLQLKQIMDMYPDAGGEALVHRIMEEKRDQGTTIMTVVHHRETPLRLQKGTVDVGPVWAMEAVYARSRKFPVKAIDPGPDLDQRFKINYFICRLEQSPHTENAEKFLAFMASPQAHAIYDKYGFIFPVQ
jgi:hypothetical protein